MIKIFRTISVLEGLSYLLILSVTFGIIGREWVFSLGIGHGFLFVMYLALSLIVSGKKGWPVWGWLILLVASVIPFAFIFVELFLRRSEQAKA